MDQRRWEKLDAVAALAGRVAHDYANYLSAVLSFATFARDALPEGEQARADVLEVLDAAARATAYGKRLLLLAQRAFGPALPLSLNDLVRQKADAGAGIEVALDLAPDLATVRADGTALDLAFGEIIANAREAMPDGGQLSIATANRGRDQVELVVRDTGRGMDAATQARLFEPFFTTKRARGAGLGLATAAGILRAFGGTIEVASTPGRGTTVTVSLPSA